MKVNFTKVESEHLSIEVDFTDRPGFEHITPDNIDEFKIKIIQECMVVASMSGWDIIDKTTNVSYTLLPDDNEIPVQNPLYL